MDDSNSSSQGLDLNPDMMTTQSGIPSVVPRPSSPSAPDSRAGIIDITPGAPDTYSIPAPTQHIDIADLPSNKVIDITPDGPVSPDLMEDDFLSAPHLSEIVPQEPESLLPKSDSTVAVSEILTETTPEVITETTPEVITETTPESLPELPTNSFQELPDESVAAIDVPIAKDQVSVTESKPAEAVIADAQVSATPTKEELAMLNPLFEDPELVKLVK